MWTHKQSTGQIRDENFRLQGTGYAGREAGKNNPQMENVKGIGPLPRGIWTGVEWIDHHPTVGKDVIRLQPDEETRKRVIAYGRDPDSFFMHGDSSEHPGLASHGCIVQANMIRKKFWASYDKKISVVA